MIARLVGAVAIVGCSSSAAEPPRAQPVDAGHDAHATPDTQREVSVDIPPPAVPSSLEETGLYGDFAARTLAPDVVPYAVRYPLWSDGSEKTRYLLVPKGKQIDTSNMDHWTFPVGTKAWKEFRRDGVLLETRYFEKSGEPPIGWKFVAYAWSADGKTTTPAKAGVIDALGTAHDIPSQDQCDQCHSGTRDGLIGVNAIQLGQATGKSPLALFAEKGLLTAPPASDFSPPGTGTVQDALGYLHGNCGYCHSDEGRWSTARKLRLRVRVFDQTPETTPTYLTTINVEMAHGDATGKVYVGVVPGSPDQSHLHDRMTKRDFWAMPPVGTEVVDPVGTALIKAWIESLAK